MNNKQGSVLTRLLPNLHNRWGNVPLTIGENWAIFLPIMELKGGSNMSSCRITNWYDQEWSRHTDEDTQYISVVLVLSSRTTTFICTPFLFAAAMIASCTFNVQYYTQKSLRIFTEYYAAIISNYLCRNVQVNFPAISSFLK